MLRLREGAVAWREVEGEILLLDLRTSKYLAANPSAGVLWQRLADGTTRDGLVGALVERFGIAAERAAADVDGFLADCRDRDLLDEEGGRD